MMRLSCTLLFLSFLLTNCSIAKSKEMLIFNDSIHPKLRWIGENKNQNILDQFQDLFMRATAHKLEIVDAIGNEETVISLKIKADSKNQFRIYREKNEVLIEGSNTKALFQGIHYFFLSFVSYYPFEDISRKTKEILIPDDLDYLQKVSFEYKEPYFKQNYEVALNRFNQTNQLEETWGIWGHQIVQLIPKSAEIFAEIDGKITDDQLCFSSKTLEKEIIKIIKAKSKENKKLHKYMIMPADNQLVCQCEACVKNGNSKSNASPAVFKLINKLAKEFPDFQIFSSAYITTDKAPSFQLEKNAGVMLSTMSFPKGIVYDRAKQRESIEQHLKKWQAVTKTIYVWDYGIHFDLYLASYPSLLIHQQNLSFLKNRGVTGVFMQGNEESYAAFEDVKYFGYAQLLLNPDVDLRSLIRFYFENQYPKAGKALADYYLEIEERAFNSGNQLDIYGGWNQHLVKYLSLSPLQDLIQNLETLEAISTRSEIRKLLKLKLALNYQVLEIMRLNGVGKQGYASVNPSGELIIKEEALKALKELEKLEKETKIEFINESHLALSTYIEFWNAKASQKKIVPILDLKLLAKSKLDEDYTDLNTLNNAKMGFYDYANNWLITSQEPLKLEIEGKNINDAETFSISFLQDTKHKIYFPEKIKLRIGEETYMISTPVGIRERNLGKYVFEIPIKNFNSADKITFETIKQEAFAKKSNACGELQFNK